MRLLNLLFFLLCTLSSYAQQANSHAQSNLIRGPYLQAAAADRITIRWRTAKPEKGIVRFGETAGALKSDKKESNSTTEHIVELKNLKANTKYYYSIGSKKNTLQGDADNYFHTLPKPGTAGLYRVGVFGDCGTNTAPQTNARDAFLKYLNPNYLNAWILLGDNAYSKGTDEEYQAKFFNIYKDKLLKQYPLFPAPGNHDYANTRDSAHTEKALNMPYYRNFTMPVDGKSGGMASKNEGYYSFDIGNAHFLSLDSYGDYKGSRLSDTLSEQVEWVKRDLKENKNKQWVIAYFHHPPYTMGTHDSDKETELVKIRENFIGILERYGVDLILCGHSHSYERSKIMKGYIGNEASFLPKYNLSQSNGKYNGETNSCPYVKSSTVNEGTVYVVTGSAGKIGSSKKEFPHNAMEYSNISITGASILEIEGNRLDLKWICADGVIRDQFTMMKDVNQQHQIRGKKGLPLILTASYSGKYNWSTKENGKSITVNPQVGKTRYTVSDDSKCITDVFEVIIED